MGALITMFFIWLTAFTLASPLYIFRNLKTHKLGLIGMDSLMIAHVQIHRRLRGRRRTTRKTPAILIAIAVTYVISWLPLNVFNLVADFSPEPFMDEKTMTITYAICPHVRNVECCFEPSSRDKEQKDGYRGLTALAQLEQTVTANTKTSQCSQIF
ncbi:hypothetical protein ACJJTC_014322 [Scirpophaga incertulas]